MFVALGLWGLGEVHNFMAGAGKHVVNNKLPFGEDGAGILAKACSTTSSVSWAKLQVLDRTISFYAPAQ